MESYQKLELYGTLYEANDTDLIQSCIREIDFRGESFTTAGMHVMSSDIRRCNHLTRVCLINCNLNAELVHILQSNLEGSCLKLDELDVGYNSDLGPAGWAEVGLVVTQCQVKVFKAENCNLTAEGMKAFKENTGKAKLDELDVSYNEDLEPAGWAEVGLVVTQCQVKVFKAWDCNLTAEGMKAFKENTGNAKLDELDVSRNIDLGPAGLAVVGLVVTQCQVKVFKAWGCKLTAEGMKLFKENTLNAKIKLLDLSRNQVSDFGDEGLTTISEIVHQCLVETLEMNYCFFNSDQLERFKALIADTGV
uniref:ribonuclease inhibitor-like n=1 Tax=Styela clava TaxID=7725 RepID=UPI00193A7569|nr:ribonuclease inhibitor-like [Styela clava]